MAGISAARRYVLENVGLNKHVRNLGTAEMFSGDVRAYHGVTSVFILAMFLDRDPEHLVTDVQFERHS